MALHMTTHWILILAAVILGMVELGARLYARGKARRELWERGWVCIDLPSPDSVHNKGVRWGKRPRIGQVLSAMCSLALLIVATCMLFQCS